MGKGHRRTKTTWRTRPYSEKGGSWKAQRVKTREPELPSRKQETEKAWGKALGLAKRDVQRYPHMKLEQRRRIHAWRILNPEKWEQIRKS